MNSDYIPIVCYIGSGLDKFALSIPCDKTTGWLKGIINDNIKLPAPAFLYKIVGGFPILLPEETKLSGTLGSGIALVARVNNEDFIRVLPVVERTKANGDLPPVTKALILSVKKLGKWDDGDVTRNKGAFRDMPLDLTNGLKTPLFFKLDVLAGDSVTQQLAKVYGENLLVNKCFDQQRGRVIIDKFEDLRLIGEICTKVVAGAQQLKDIDASSSQIATFFIGSFIHGIFGKFTKKQPNGHNFIAEGPLTYQEGTAWEIPLLPIELPSVSEKDCRSYRPKSDFSVSYWPSGCPCLIGEVVSDKTKTEEDRWRMLVQGIAIARAGGVLITPSFDKHGFVLMAIYVSAKLVAFRHLLRVNPQNKEGVDICMVEYDLTNKDNVVDLLLELFNWRARAVGEAGNLKAYEMLSELNQYAAGRPQLTTKEKGEEGEDEGEEGEA